jgi:hypothetical protein
MTDKKTKLKVMPRGSLAAEMLKTMPPVAYDPAKAMKQKVMRTKKADLQSLISQAPEAIHHAASLIKQNPELAKGALAGAGLTHAAHRVKQGISKGVKKLFKKKSSYEAGLEEGMKLAADEDNPYTPGYHKTQRKIERQERRGYGVEKSRLRSKGRKSGAGKGGGIGGVLGGVAGAAAGALTAKNKGDMARRAIKGGIAGAAGGGAVGAAVGGHKGGRAGEEEADRRQTAVRAIRPMNPGERRNFFRDLHKQKAPSETGARK